MSDVKKDDSPPNSVSTGNESSNNSGKGKPFGFPFPDPELNSASSNKSYLSTGLEEDNTNETIGSGNADIRARLNRSYTDRPNNSQRTSSSETTPLLTRTRRATESLIETANTRARRATATMINTANIISKEAWKQMQRQRFITSLILGFFCMILLNLIFLPRTSLDRDLRRLHGIILPSADVERVFLQRLSSDTSNIEFFLKNYTTTVPHLAGDGSSLVDYTVDHFTKFGLKTNVETYETYLNNHVDSHLWLLEDDSLQLDVNLEEDSLDEDPTTGDKDKSIPAFHGYSANGNVTSKFIYANYGSKEDFNNLLLSGVETNGTIAIVRYGAILRGLKVKFAQQYGCSGVIMYSDPYDDGPITTQNGYLAYPEGKARNPSSIQRGSVDYFTDQPGDPTTPGWSSTKFAKRVSPNDYIPQIPSIPVSYRSIEPILKKLNGLGPKLGWEGGLDSFDYSPGPSPETLKLNLYNLQDYKIKPIHNVIGEIKGVMQDEEIIIGNHRDAWIFGGAGDPNSGSATILEIARGFSELLKMGWKPLRTIKLISWDGEEYAMLGSTEYGEYYEKVLQKKNLAYINVDAAVTGSSFTIASNPLFDSLIHSSAEQVGYKNDPKISLSKQWHTDSNKTIYSIGGGSDFTVFQNHLGIPSIDVGFTSDGSSDAVYHYHSNYDSYHWLEKFIDPDFKLHSTLAQFVGLLTLQLSEREVIHVSSWNYADKINQYFENLKDIIPHYWLPRLVDSYDDDPYVKNIISQLSETNDKVTFKDIVDAVQEKLVTLIETTETFDAYATQLQRDILRDYPWFKYYIKIKLAIQIKIANKKIMALDRLLLVKEGLAGRPWMKHIVFSPDRDLGYAGDCLPGVHEALRDTNYERAVKSMAVLALKIDDVSNRLS